MHAVESTGVLTVVLAVLAMVAVLVVPGLPTVLALRLRPLTAAAALAPTSLSLIAITAEIGHQARIPWSVLSPVVLGLLLGAALIPLGRRLTPHPTAVGTADAAADDAGLSTDPHPASARRPFFSRPRGLALAVLGGLALGGGTVLVRALMMMGSIDAISQSYDNVFHLNAVRHILRAGDGSAWVVGGMTALPGEAAYYPSLWHQAVSLGVQLSGQEIILVSNVMMLLVSAVVWPLGLMALVRTTTACGPFGLFAAGGLAGMTAAFPQSLMSWGIVLPYLLSVALMPLVVMVVAHIAGLAERRLRTSQLLVLAPLILLSAALAHPQGVFVGIALGLPILGWAALVRARDLVLRAPDSWRRFWPLALLTLVAAVVSRQIWLVARPPQSSAVWRPNATLTQAIGQVGSLSPNATPAWVPLGVVMLLCLIAVLLLTTSRWLVASWLGAAALSVATRATPPGDLRYLLTGNWYSDNYRISALVPVVAIPLLAVGIDVIGRRLLRLLTDRRPRISAGSTVAGRLVGPIVGLLAVLGVLTLSLSSPATAVNENYLEADWRSTVLLSPDERALLEQLPDVVPEDAVIATNAWNGSSLAYAISDRPVLNTFMGFEAEPEVHLLNGRLDEAQTNPEVCDAAEDLDVEYALDFGPQELHGRSASYTGLNEISETEAAEVVLQVGDAKLLRMLPCRGTDGSMTS